jgi:hypothetical protein|tara:strand:+ start:2022 stop:2300 length:279 start_codon:yes stop_codon:yes gene_type:complete
MNKNDFLKLGEIMEKEIEKEALKEKLYLDNKKKGILDAFQEKVVSRKLLVFICSTALLWNAQLDPETWGMIAMVYIGGQTVVDFAKMWRHGA